ncbi:hypothetical protein P12x_002442 [Tundrisphaera lichenicola]|uniref:hypothetical protein n=1 Tax=Tundrisphaera lichenicola TaxID=2029860 RepID=UPI003EBE12FD
MGPDWIDEARAKLLQLRRGAGAWGYRANTSPAVEPSALAGLALMATEPAPDGPGRRLARETGRWLASIRRPDGSTGVSTLLAEPGWTTPYSVLLWAATGGFDADRASACRWLLATEGLAVPKIKDDPMGHDGMLVGWPWVEGTHSWVEPTSLALLALRREGHAGHRRAIEGGRVLLDRAIPGGGWNAGNTVVFGTALRPLPGPSGLALLGLWGADDPSGVIRAGIVWLADALAGTMAPVSIGWGSLGLRAWGATPSWLPERIEASARKVLSRAPDAVELALLLLAAGERSLAVLGISPGREVASDA